MPELLGLMRAVLALLAATMAVSTAQVLRADSDSAAPGLASTVAVLVLLTLLFWPLTRRRRRLSLLFGLLLATQVLGHLLVSVATTGSFGNGGAAGLVCCPAVSMPTHGGGLAALTAQAGWLLLAVQAGTALVFAASWKAAQGALQGLAEVLARAIGKVLPGVAPLRVTRPPYILRQPCLGERTTIAPGAGRDVGGAVHRRGPPRVGFVPPARPSVHYLRGPVAR